MGGSWRKRLFPIRAENRIEEGSLYRYLGYKQGKTHIMMLSTSAEAIL